MAACALRRAVAAPSADMAPGQPSRVVFFRRATGPPPLRSRLGFCPTGAVRAACHMHKTISHDAKAAHPHALLVDTLLEVSRGSPARGTLSTAHCIIMPIMGTKTALRIVNKCTGPLLAH